MKYLLNVFPEVVRELGLELFQFGDLCESVPVVLLNRNLSVRQLVQEVVQLLVDVPFLLHNVVELLVDGSLVLVVCLLVLIDEYLDLKHLLG